MPPLSSSTNSCCKLFLRSHVWLRLKMVNESVSVLQSSSSHLFPVMPSPTLFMVDVGLTKRGLDDIGDITSIQIPSADAQKTELHVNIIIRVQTRYKNNQR